MCFRFRFYLPGLGLVATSYRTSVAPIIDGNEAGHPGQKLTQRFGVQARYERGGLRRVGWKLLGIALRQVAVGVGHNHEDKGEDHEDGDAHRAGGARGQPPAGVGKEVPEVVGMNAPSSQALFVKLPFVFWPGLPAETAHFIGQGIQGSSHI